MTAAAANHGPGPYRERLDSPRDIRAALLPEEVGEFDEAYQRALRLAAETLSLEALHSMLANWRRIARMTLVNPAGHRRMLEQAQRTMETGQPPEGAVEWNQLRAELGI
ncbi:DUF6247 family protein [Amycolatopsis pithecellobii]|uniref:Uncharacterized protein n=1 Tax=Amycolatopsis pithecellobii TaxID=664692 RepID=A0A6N7Z0K2_9PSEU|nr:DUF6247 family protein [Amycolatopsis pithecellobii]MTD54833.1 hypothetical protein [Amycolatopsis pithecellobii]